MSEENVPCRLRREEPAGGRVGSDRAAVPADGALPAAGCDRADGPAGCDRHEGCDRAACPAATSAAPAAPAAAPTALGRLRAAASSVLARMPERAPYALMACLLLALLAACLVPMLRIAAFDHSYADDWHYGMDAHLALESGAGLAGAVRAAAGEVRDTFFSWQGTYSAIFLMALQPGVFAESLYGLGAVGIVSALVAATFYACGVLVRELLGADRAAWMTASCLVLLLQTQLLPSPVEGFYWYNSAVYYTFYHALALVMTGMSVRMARGRTRRGAISRPGLALRAAVLCALAIFVAGGNFVTGVVACLVLFGAVAATALLGRPRRALVLAPALLALVAGFALSMAAPGNAERQASQYPDDALDVLPTLVRSGLAAVEYSVLWTGGLLILALAVALPFMVRAARRSRLSFARPWLPAACSFALFAASFTPTFYSMGTVGPGRVQNIRYDLFVLLVLVCAQWFAGWCVRRLERRGAIGALVLSGPDAADSPVPGPDEHGPSALDDPAEPSVLGPSAPDAPPEPPAPAVPPAHGPAAPAVPPAFKGHAAAYLGVCALVLALASAAFLADGRHAHDLTSLSAAASLSDGTAAEYDRQVRERLDYLADARARGETEVEVPYYDAAPRVLYMGEIRDNMGNYINYRLAQWFGLESVVGYSSPMR